jgi:flagellar hook-associated protein 3 FlgL
MIYTEGNATYAGRYIFSGYKTDRGLTFTETEDTSKYSYDINQSFTATDFETKNVVLNSVDDSKVDEYIANPDSYEQPDPEMVYKLSLAYANISEKNNNGDTVLSLSAKDADGNAIDLSAYPVTVKKAADADTYYDVEDNGINIIEETGEIIFGKDAYNFIKTAASIDVSYAKTEFEAGDIRPEHYFGCTQYTKQVDGSDPKVTVYDEPTDKQAIYYEVNFNQSIQVNT